MSEGKRRITKQRAARAGLFVILIAVVLSAAWAVRRGLKAPKTSVAAGPVKKKASAKEPVERKAIYEILRAGGTVKQLDARIRPHCARWIDDYKAVLTRIQSEGYTIVNFEKFDMKRVDQKIAYMRHDIHHRDIIGAACMMMLEREMGVRASYYLLWDYDHFELAHRDDYLQLKKLAGREHRFGLHYSLVDEYFYWKNCGPEFDPKCLRATLDKFVLTPDYKEIASGEFVVPDPARPEVSVYADIEKITSAKMREILRYSESRLKEHLANLRKHFGPVETLAAHSGVLAVVAMNASAANPQVSGGHLSTSHLLLSQKRMKELGLKQEIYQLFPVLGDRIGNITDSSLNMVTFEEMLSSALKKGAAITILIHPAAWETGVIQASRAASGQDTHVE